MSEPIQGTGVGLAPNFLTKKQEALAVGIVGVSGGLYILKSLPSMFFPQGILALLVSLILGLFLGLLLAGCILFFLFYRFTHPAPPRAIPSLPIAPPIAAGSGSATTTATTGSRMNRMKSSTKSSANNTPPRRDVTHPSSTLPHAITSRGELHGVLFTITQAHWDRTSVVVDWPPSSSSGFKTWHASLTQGTLVLTPLPRHHHHAPQDNKNQSPSPEKDSNRSNTQQQQEKKNTKKKDNKQEGDEKGGEEKDNYSQQTAEGVVEAANALAAATDAVPTSALHQQHHKVGIPLEGCTIELVRDGLQGRSEVVRRAPLLLSNPNWPLLDGSPEIFIFATDPAAKQEWLHALSYWCVDGERMRLIEETYAMFCSVMAQKSTLPFVQENFSNILSSTTKKDGGTGAGAGAPAGGTSAAAAATLAGGASGSTMNGQSQRRGEGGEDAKFGKKSSWRRWKERKNNLQPEDQEEEELDDEKEEGVDIRSNINVHTPRVTANGQNVGSTSSQPRQHANATVTTTITAAGVEFRPPVSVAQINSSAVPPITGSVTTANSADIDSIIEMRWMQSRKVPVPPAPAKQKGTAGGGAGGSTSTPPSTATSLTPSPSISPVKVPPIGPVVYRKVAPGEAVTTTTAAGSGSVAAALSRGTSSSLPGTAQTSPMKSYYQQMYTTGERYESRANSGEQQGRFLNPSSSTTTNTPHPTQQPVSPRTQAAQTAASSRLPQGFPAPLLPFDFFINSTATRVCFDLIRNPAFSEHVRARIQRQLSRMHTPDYVTSLEVVSVEPGCTAPTLSKFAAVPQPAAHDAFPQLIFDMKYSGSFTVTIECKVDIRDAPAWSALDHAIDRIEGKGTKKKKKKKTEKRGNDGKSENLADDDDEDNEDDLDLLGDEEDEESCEELRLLRPSSSSSSMTSDLGGSPTASSGGSPKCGDAIVQQPHQPKRRLLGQIRHHTAQKLRKLADSTATRISNLPLRVSLTFETLEGTMCIWLPPPPGDRLFWSFLSPPKLSLRATPQIGQRLIKYAYHASRASAWIQARMELAFRKNMVFPCGGDLALPLLLPFWNPRAFDKVPGLDKEEREKDQKGGGASGSGGGSSRPAVSVTRQPVEKRTETVQENNGVSRAVNSNETAPFVEFNLRRPRNNNGGAG